jgi:hypothetical protein
MLGAQYVSGMTALVTCSIVAMGGQPAMNRLWYALRAYVAGL